MNEDIEQEVFNRLKYYYIHGFIKKIYTVSTHPESFEFCFRNEGKFCIYRFPWGVHDTEHLCWKENKYHYYEAKVIGVFDTDPMKGKVIRFERNE